MSALGFTEPNYLLSSPRFMTCSAKGQGDKRNQVTTEVHGGSRAFPGVIADLRKRVGALHLRPDQIGGYLNPCLTYLRCLVYPSAIP